MFAPIRRLASFRHFRPLLPAAAFVALTASASGGAFKYKDTPGDMKWPGGRIPYVFSGDMSQGQREEFERAARAWQKVANLNFVLTHESNETLHISPEGNYVLVQSNILGRDVNFAFIGRCGSFTFPFTGMQPLSINAWDAQSVVVHEIGHVLGFIHEQTRTDRDQFVELDWTNINPLTSINWNIEPNAILQTAYDYDSIMHYSSDAYRYPWSTGDAMRATQDPSKTATMGRTNWEAEGLDYTEFLSDLDGAAVSGYYGAPASFGGYAVSANGHFIQGATVRLVGAGADEENVVRLMSRTQEDVVTTGQNGEFTFDGLPTGSYQVTIQKDGLNFATDEIAFVATPGSVGNSASFIAVESIPPTVTITTPAAEPNHSYQSLTSVSGKAEDSGGTDDHVKEVLLAVSNSQQQWWNWNTGSFDSATFSWSSHTRVASRFNTSWTGTNFPALAEGSYQLHARARDFSDNVSDWNSRSFTIDTTPPELSSYASGGTFFDFETQDLQGWMSDALDSEPQVSFRIQGPDGRFWNGTGWTTLAGQASTNLPAQVDDGQWLPSPALLLPPRHLLAPGSYKLTVSATDGAGNITTLDPVELTRSETDAEVPEVAIHSPADGAAFTERVMPQIAGSAYDWESYIRGVRLYLMHLGAGGNLRYWNGDAWQDSVTHLEVELEGDHGNGGWSAPAFGYRLPAGEELPDGTYLLQAAAFNRENPQGTRLVQSTFFIGIAPPQVTVTTPLHAGFGKAGWQITGTTVDPSGSGFLNNRVTLTIFRDGRFWNGSAWGASGGAPIELHATLQPDGTWSYPGETGGILPPEEGEYAVSASVQDNNGLSSVPVAGGYHGNNQITFRVDTTPPQLTLSSPAAATTLSAGGLVLSLAGTASDSYPPQPEVVVHVQHGENDNYWTGRHWTWQVDQGALAGNYTGSGSTWQAGNTPASGWDTSHQMTPGTYLVTAVARDTAGNETRREAALTVELPTGFTSEPAPPEQATPLAASQVSLTERLTLAPLADDDLRNQDPDSLRIDAAGNAILGVNLSRVTGVDYDTVRWPTAEVVKQAADGTLLWRKERLLQRIHHTIDGLTSTSYWERWGPGEEWREIDGLDFLSYYSLDAVEMDAAGNIYAGYALYQVRNVQYATSSSGSPLFHDAPVRINIGLVVKFDPAGNLVWRARIEGEHQITAIRKIEPLADGSAAVLASNSWYHHSPYWPYTYSSGEQAIVARVGAASGNFRRGFGYSQMVGASYNSAGLGMGLDGTGNILLATKESEPDDINHHTLYRIRKFAPNGTELDAASFPIGTHPETWKEMAVDPGSGDVFFSGVAPDSADDTSRLAAARVDLDRAAGSEVVWRAYGPPRSAGTGAVQLVLGQDFLAVGDTAYTTSNTSDGPYQVSVVSFDLAGNRRWARTTAHPDLLYDPEFGTTRLGLSTMIADAAGNLLLVVNGKGEGVIKMAANGDLQFAKPFPENTLLAYHSSGDDRAFRVLADGRMAALTQEGKVIQIANPANVAVPLAIDPDQPGDRFIEAGSTLTLAVAHAGSPATYQWQKDDANGVPQPITGATGSSLTLTNVQSSTNGSYRVVLTSTVDPSEVLISRPAQVTVYDTATLAEALDTTGLTWTTGGDAAWLGQTGDSHDGIDAAMNPLMENSQVAWLQTTVSGPGTFSFYWKESSEGYDHLALYLDPAGDSDGTMLTNAWSSDWVQQTVQVAAGSHTLRFKLESGWQPGRNVIDRVTFVSGSQAPAVTITSPVDGTAYELPAVSGTASDVIESVTFGICRMADDRWWNGAAWVVDTTELSATLNTATGTWHATGSLPTGSDLADGQYQFTAWGRNRTGAEVSDTVWTTLFPGVTLGVSFESPLEGSSLNGIFYAGGQATPLTESVTLRIQRLIDQRWWNGSDWADSPTELSVNHYPGAENWYLDELPMFDPGDYQFTATATAADGETASSSVVASAIVQSSGPVLTGLTLTPAAADVTSSAQPLAVSLTADREIEYGAISLVSPDGAHRVSASFGLSEKNGGAYVLELMMPRYASPGAWSVEVYLQDASFGAAFYGPDGTALPVDATAAVQVTNHGTVDEADPFVTALTMAPSPVVAGGSPQPIIVTIDASDDLGLEVGYFTLRAPSGDSLYGTLDAHTRISGTAKAGRYQFIVNLPPGAETGEWTAELYLVDIASRSTFYDPAYADPFPAGIVAKLLVQDGSGGTTQPSLAQWSSTQFHPGTPEALRAWDADPDGDGMVNLLEYAFNFAPQAADKFPQPQQVYDPETQQTYLELSYNERIGSSGVSYDVIVSDNLGAWAGGAANIERVAATPNPDGLTQRVTVRLPTAAASSRFMRVQVIAD